MSPQPEVSLFGRLRLRTSEQRVPRSRRSFVKAFLLLPLAFRPLRAQIGSITPKCCSGPFQPDQLFAPISLSQESALARQGDLAATIRVGFAYFTGTAGRVDVERARSYFLVASRKSSAASALLGYLDAAARRIPGAKLRNSSSFRGLLNASTARDPVAMTLLGQVYEQGLAGYRPKPDKAKDLYTAAAPDFALAKTYLGMMLLKERAYKDAIALFEAAAAAGETTAIIALADLYSRGGQMDLPKAKRMLRTAAERRDRRALYLLGLQYQNGTRGFPRDLPRGLRFLHQSASLGYQRAQAALADAYANGAGGAASAELARFWARKASLPSLRKPRPPVHT
jgi:TPR repeat protein